MADWIKQTKDQPAFADLLWSRPENKRQAGKLLIIGGSAHGFAAVGQAYQAAEAAGIGVVKVLLPDALQKTVGSMMDNAEFTPSTTSGSFNQRSLEAMLSLGDWAEGVLIAGELGRNAETAATLEAFCDKYHKLLVITRDAVDSFYSHPAAILQRPQTAIALSLAQLQRLASEAQYPEAVTFSMGLAQLAEWLAGFSRQYPSAQLMTKHSGQLWVASGGQVSSTKTDDTPDEPEHWRVPRAASAAVWWLQNPGKPFEALTSSIIA